MTFSLHTQKPSVQLVLSVITIIVGVAAVCFRDSTVSIAPIVIAMLSNFVLPMRNVLSKKIMISNAEAPKEASGNPHRLLSSIIVEKMKFNCFM